MKLLEIKNGINHVICRYIGHKRLMRLKRMRDHSYTPWKSAEVVANIEETLKTPYQQIVPSSQVKRISESNPANHTYRDIGKFYIIPEEHNNHYFRLNAYPEEFYNLTKVFNETAIMVRKPALEVIECMKNANYDKLPVKYILYGENGCGKRMSRIHILHYAFLNGFVVLDIPSVMELFQQRRKEIHVSEKRPPFVDLPLEGALLLKNFQTQNGALIEDLKLKTTKNYVWNDREETPAGTPLMELINHGINRVKYSCDCLDGLVDELKLAANNGQIKLLVCANGVNVFFVNQTYLIAENKSVVYTRDTTIFQSFIKFLEPNWSLGYISKTTYSLKYLENTGDFGYKWPLSSALHKESNYKTLLNSIFSQNVGIDRSFDYRDSSEHVKALLSQLLNQHGQTNYKKLLWVK